MHSVTLHGHLASYHDGPLRIVGQTIAEVVEGVTRLLPGFRPHPIHGHQRIKVIGCETEADLQQLLEQDTEIHIVPQLSGGKKGGLTQILIGAALVGIGLFTFGAGTALGSLLIKVGALALLGGLAQLLSPTPEDDKDSELKSRYLGSPKNTVEIGTRIPILYGETRVYGHYLSFDIDSVETKGPTKRSGGQGK